MSEEKRRHVRFRSLNLSHISVEEQESDTFLQGMGRTLNVSMAGILLETSFEVPPGSRMLLSVGLEDDLIELSGKSVYSKATGTNLFETGIEFVDVAQNQRPILEKFVESIQSANAS